MGRSKVKVGGAHAINFFPRNWRFYGIILLLFTVVVILQLFTYMHTADVHKVTSKTQSNFFASCLSWFVCLFWFFSWFVFSLVLNCFSCCLAQPGSFGNVGHRDVRDTVVCWTQCSKMFVFVEHDQQNFLFDCSDSAVQNWFLGRQNSVGMKTKLYFYWQTHVFVHLWVWHVQNCVSKTFFFSFSMCNLIIQYDFFYFSSF